MKKVLCFRIVLIAALLGLVWFSACKKNKPLKLQGEWEQESYWVPNDTIAADTLIRTYTLSNIVFDAGCREGVFHLKRVVYHPYYHRDPALGGNLETDSVGLRLDSIGHYTEYVAGKYSTAGKKMILEGEFYLDESYVTPADSTNPDYYYSYGRFYLEATFKIDNERLIIEGTTNENPTTQIFRQISESRCGGI